MRAVTRESKQECLLIGASLSEPHTSVTALRTCVYIYQTICLSMLVWTDHLTINFKSAHSNILRREIEHEGLLLACRVGVKEGESEDYSS